MILIALPILLRGERHLGRWGALTASTLFLISPALLYQSRYIRHDIFTVVGALVLFIAIMRYIERPARGWLITIGATLGFLLTNHEIVFGIAAIFFAIIAGALLWGRLRTWLRCCWYQASRPSHWSNSCRMPWAGHCRPFPGNHPRRTSSSPSTGISSPIR